MLGESQEELFAKARRYCVIRYTLVIIAIAYLLILLLVFLAVGCSPRLAAIISVLVPNNALAFLLYLLVLLAGYSLLESPLNFYRSFILEHRFGLSRQNIGDWLCDQLKSGIISYIIAAIAFGAFYYLLAHYPFSWWLILSVFWIFFSFILVKVFPLVIIPLFFKYRPIPDQTLKSRIKELAERMRIKILDVFEIDFSKKTLKANAALVGWGVTRRVILADTLKDRYSHDEITVILAHEFAHFKLKHLLKSVAINSLVTVLALYLIFKNSTFLATLFRLKALSDIASLPLIILCLTIFNIITRPLENYLSRRMERSADLTALESTRDKEAFIGMMEKVASQNLADRKPHPLIKFFFFDHPPIEERINMARDFNR